MQYDEFMKIGTTADQLQAIIDGAFLENSSYADYAPPAVQSLKAEACLAGLKSELAALSEKPDSVGEKMLAELNVFHAFLDSIRIAVRPVQPKPSSNGDQSGFLNDDGTLKAR